jgi:hypothetical protein
MDIAHGTLLHGPVTFKLLCNNPAITTVVTENMKRVAQVWKAQKMAITWFPNDRRLKRLVLALRVYDAICDHASYQDIARVLYGDERVEQEWNAASDSLRSSIRRIASQAKRLAEGGYHGIMRL